MAACAACGKALPPEARFCPACGAPVEEAAVATEERKVATVLFADLVGSTQLGEQDPERTRALLDRFYDAMAGEIAGAGGTVEKFAGDAVMAAFGAPAALEDHAERALHAALAMLRRLDELFDAQLALRIGVNTGEVVVGRPREGSSFVTGDAVNVAARLEEAAKPGEILVGERTVAAVRGAFEFGDPAKAPAKGKALGVDCRRLERALTLMRPRGLAGLRQSFVGREHELELLEVTYRRAVDQAEPHVVTIMGDAGVGKTRLVRELWAWLADASPQPVQRTGRCLSYGHGITYWPFAEILREHLGILESDPPERALQRLGERRVLALSLGLDVGEELHPLAARDHLHEAWVGLLEEIVADRPAVLLLEDLHWAESELLDLLGRILREVSGPLLLVATSRPELLEARPAWGAGRRNASLVWLEPLSADHTGRLVDELLAADLPGELREAVVERAEGNPFFVEELIATLADQGVLERRDGSWEARALPSDFEIPDSVQAVLSARIDLLPSTEKAALQAASVVGRIFWAGPVRELIDGLEPDFAVLEDRDFVRRRAGSTLAGEQEYAIKHALTREVAYASLPKARRARLHARFADWLERFGESRDEHASFLAHHYAEAVRPEDADLAWAGDKDELDRLTPKAVHWLARAADLALRRYEIDEALSLLRRALELESGSEERARLWKSIGLAHAAKFDGKPFWEAMHKALELSEDSRLLAETYAELVLETVTRSGMWPELPDPELIRSWIEQAHALSEPGTPVRARSLVGAAFGYRYTDPKRASAAARDAQQLAESLADPWLRAAAFWAREDVAFTAERYEEAHDWILRGLDLVSELNDPDWEASLYGTAAGSSAVLGRFREARRFSRLHRETADRLTPHHRVHGVAFDLEVAELVAEWSSIRALTAEAEERVAANEATPCVRNARSLLICACAHAALGDDREARRLEDEGERLSTSDWRVVLDAPRIRLALVRGELERVERLVEGVEVWRRQSWFFPASVSAHLDGLLAIRARERIEEQAPVFARPRTYMEPFALRALGAVREDEGLIQRALERFRELGLDWHADQTRALLAAD